MATLKYVVPVHIWSNDLTITCLQNTPRIILQLIFSKVVFFSICVDVYLVKDCTIPPNNTTLRTTFGGIYYYKIPIIWGKFPNSNSKNRALTSKLTSFENQIPLQWYFVNNTFVFTKNTTLCTTVRAIFFNQVIGRFYYFSSE